MIVLSADRTLIDLLRDSLAGYHRVWRADDVAHAGELILTAGNPVFLIEVLRAIGETRELVNRVHQQFPDVAIVVAGNRDNELQFAPLVTSGDIFRYLHLPASADSIRTTVDATQRAPGTTTDLPAAAPRKALSAAIAGIRPSFKLPRLKLPRVSVNRAWVRHWSGRCLRLGALLLTVWVLWQWKPWDYASELFAKQEPEPAAAADIGNDAKLLKLLDDAGTALSRDRLVEPPGQNALELYRAALLLDPDNAMARSGIDTVAEKLLAEADQALKDRDLPRLASAIDAARSARPDHPRLQYYSSQLKRERERIFGPEKPRTGSTAGDP